MRYRRIQDVLDSIDVAKYAGMKTMTFDWEDIDVRERRRLIRLCRIKGKVKRRKYGFVVFL